MINRYRTYITGIALASLLAACSNGHNKQSGQYQYAGQQGSGYAYNAGYGQALSQQLRPAYDSPQQAEQVYFTNNQFAYTNRQGYAMGRQGHDGVNRPQYVEGQNYYAGGQSYSTGASNHYTGAQNSVAGQNYAADGQSYYAGEQNYYSPAYGYGYQSNLPRQLRPSSQYQRPQYKGSKFSYESLNAFEAPVATEIAGVTFELRGRMDSVTDYSFERDGNPDHRFVGSHWLTAQKQLSNRLTLGAEFTGRAEDIGNSNSDYKGRIRGFIGSSWGTILGGNVQDVVYADTRRLRGAGLHVGAGPREETLHGDGALGRLNDWGGGYQGRFGPTTLSVIVDEDANYDVGIKFQRPIGNKDYRLTARHNSGTYLAADDVTEIETKAVTGVGEYVYGSTRYDIGGGYEQLDTGISKADRWFTSAGVTTKSGLWNLTAEGHYGQIDGQNEISAFVGVKYDIARGLSATAAVDYQDRQINVDGINLINEKDTRALMGLSYGF